MSKFLGLHSITLGRSGSLAHTVRSRVRSARDIHSVSFTPEDVYATQPEKRRRSVEDAFAYCKKCGADAAGAHKLEIWFVLFVTSHRCLQPDRPCLGEATIAERVEIHLSIPPVYYSTKMADVFIFTAHSTTRIGIVYTFQATPTTTSSCGIGWTTTHAPPKPNIKCEYDSLIC